MKLSAVFTLFSVLLASPAFALVDMNSASYSNVWTDLEVPGGGYDLKVLRAYKSRTLFNGMFGFGWCSNFETKLENTSEGNIKISECGDGQEIIFSAREMTRKDVESTISQIISKIRNDPKNKSINPDYLKKLSVDLIENDEMRSRLATQYRVAIPVKEGMRFLANGKEVENVVFNKTHYTRNMPDGSYQRFDLQGRMTHNYDKNGNFLKFEYNGDLLIQVEDNNSRKLSFKHYPNKKVRQITGPNNLVTEYKYNSQEDLVWNRNAWARPNMPTDVYTYEYNEFHNLTKITWPDATFALIKYDNIKDWVVSFTDRNKCVENYKYEFSKVDPKFHYWSSVIKTCGKEVVANNRYEFWHKQLPSGQVVLSRVLTTVNGNTQDISYHDTLGKAISIRRNNEKVFFEYYPDGLVKARTGNKTRVDFTHDPTSKKVSSVKTSFFDDKGKAISVLLTSFKYDNKGNLVYAENSDGQKVNMSYDYKGRIATITDQAKKVVKIEYEERFGKPAVVSRPGLGLIRVSYKANGEIAKVDSDAGASVASQVASTFNNLLDVISPATKDLYM